jgi:chorismate mutase
MTPDTLLEDIRREIDEIDDELLDLMVRRVGATERVRLTKGNVGVLAFSPYRPAREAQILRRLLNRGAGRADPHFLVRLWRVILSTSTLAQAPVSIHISRAGMAVSVHDNETAALAAMAERRCDLAFLAASSDWADGFASASADGLQLIGCLPVLQTNGPPEAFVAGYVQPQPSDDDETIILTSGPVPSDVVPSIRWHLQSGQWTVTSLAGFLETDDGRIETLQKCCTSLSPWIAGRIPRPIEVLR